MTGDGARPVIIGSGYIAARHAAALRELGLSAAGVYSPNQERSAAFARRWGTVAQPSLQAVLDLPGVTHAHLCSPTMQHEQGVLAATERGVVPVCEKPLAPSVDVARLLAEAANRSGLESHLMFNRRFDDGVQALRRAVANGALGEPVNIFGSYQQQWNAAPSSRDWRFDPRQIGPSRVVSEIGSHWFDLASHVLGTVLTEVAAQTTNMGPRAYEHKGDAGVFTPDNEDAFSALVRFGTATGAVFATQLAHGAWDDIELRIDGTEQSGWWSSRLPNQLFLANKTSGTRVVGLASETRSIESCIAEIYQPFGERIGADFGDGVRNCAALDAVLAASSTGSWTKVSSHD